jgi:hypothetical protein
MIFVCSTMFLYAIKSDLIERQHANEPQIVATDSTDTLFNEYRLRATAYLSQPLFSGTPLTGEMLATCAKLTWKKWGVMIPLELALAQAQLETRLGTGGRAGHRTNPYNLGEWDTGTMGRGYKTTEQGVLAYYELLASRYFTGGRTEVDLFIDFIDKEGYRYATKEYGKYVKESFIYIKRWIDAKVAKSRV